MAIRRRDFWLGVLLVAGALLAHAMLPRYMAVPQTAYVLDRWSGDVWVGTVGQLRIEDYWAQVRREQWEASQPLLRLPPIQR